MSSAATKRDAKAYISRLKSPVKQSRKPSKITTIPSSNKSRVNLGNLFGRSQAVEKSPVFTQYETVEQTHEETGELHLALVKISDLSHLTDELVHGIAQTLSQLSRLSMSPCVVLEESTTSHTQSLRTIITEQADRLVSAIDAVSNSGARRLDGIFTFPDSGRPTIFMNKLLLRPLRRGRIPIIVPIAYSERSQTAVEITADQAILALTREFSGQKSNDEHSHDSIQKNVSVDRIIVIDETGAIPSTKTLDKRHVFVNLEQEYSTLQEELRSSTEGIVSQKHATNLRMFRDALKILPPSASGLITTPTATANPTRIELDHHLSSVGTRRQKNPLIHNLLTDKPAYSSSLPSGRLSKSPQFNTALSETTFVKRGMPLTILPDPAAQPWTAWSKPRIKLTDLRIDLNRLVYLINDSFNRELDVEAYLRRVNDRIAGIIIAGNYEGGAILTWETPPGASDTDSSRLVPYLDKFAVLKRAQGAGGVADIVFNAMVRTCFPGGVCWRSRMNNPVNKWYFERSRGTWKLPDTNWTMFWTTPGVVEGDKAFLDYEAVCRGVIPTWADGKKVVD